MQRARSERKKEYILKAIKNIDSAQYSSDMRHRIENDIEEAQKFYKILDRCERLCVRVLKMDGNTLLELRNYSSPTEDVHLVIQGTLLLLGHYEKRTRVSCVHHSFDMSLSL